MSTESSRRFLFLAGRDAAHPHVGGGDLQAWVWASWLASQGHQVHYLCQQHPDLPEAETLAGVRVARLKAGLGLPWRAWRYQRAQERFDLVYEDPIGGGRPPFLSPLWSGLPVIAVWHQVSSLLLRDLYSRPKAELLSAVERILARLYRRCFLWAPSAETAEAVVTELRMAPDRVVVIHPTSEIHDRAERPARPRRNVVALGLYRPYKAFDHAIRAWPAVLAEVPEARLVIAGRRSDLAYEASMRDLVASLELEASVSFRTDLSELEKQQLLDASDLMVLPSRLEGYGIVTIEANDAGLPVVASSGVPVAAVTDQRNGLRYRFGDIVALSRLMIACLQGADLYDSLVDGCRTHAEQRTVSAMAPRFAALVEAAMSRTSSAFPLGRDHGTVDRLSTVAARVRDSA